MPSVADLARRAARHHSVFSTEAALRAGIGYHQLRRLERDGMVERLARSLYRFTGTPLDWKARTYVATRLAGPDALASHLTAAALLGFDGIAPPGPSDPIEIVVPRRRRNVLLDAVQPARVHSSLALGAADRCLVDDIPTTTPARTLAMLGTRVGSDRLEQVWDDAERRKLAPRMPVERRHGQIRARGRDGVGILAEVIERREQVGHTPWNVFERRFLREVIGAHGLPEPVCQMKVQQADGRVAWVDFGYPTVRFGVEVLGHVAHATRTERARDARRHNAVLLAAVDLAYYTWEQVHASPTAVADDLRRHLRQRGLPC